MNELWYITVPSLLAFFGVQVTACVLFLRALRHWGESISNYRLDQSEMDAAQDLTPDLRQSHDLPGTTAVNHEFTADNGAAGFDSSFPWMSWVCSEIGVGDCEPIYSRDDALSELNMRIGSLTAYVILQRTGAMAPLFGVILTVIGFLMLDSTAFQATNNQSQAGFEIGQIFHVVLPLAAGVGGGAVLALINQVFMICVTKRAEQLRTDARCWFDQCIWRNAASSISSAKAQTIASFGKLSDSVNEAADRFTTIATSLENAFASVDRSATRLDNTLVTFQSEIEEVPRNVERLQEIAESSVGAMDVVIPACRQLVSDLHDTVAAFSDAIDTRLSAAIDKHSESAEAFAQSLEQVREASIDGLQHAASAITEATDALHSAIESHSSVSRQLEATIADNLVPTHEVMNQSTDTISVSSDQLKKAATDLRSIVSAVGETQDGLKQQLQEVSLSLTDGTREFREVATKQFEDSFASLTDELGQLRTSLSRGIDDFRQVVNEQFARAALEHFSATEELTKSVDALQDTIRQISDGGTAIEEILSDHSQASKQIEEINSRLIKDAADLATAAELLSSSVEADVVPGNKALNQCIENLKASADQLARFMNDGLTPATERLVQLENAAANLNDTAVDVSNLRALRSDIESLSESLNNASARISQAADAIEQAPANLAAILRSQTRRKSQVDGRQTPRRPKKKNGRLRNIARWRPWRRS